MKAYQVWDCKDDYGYSTIVFAENCRKAKIIAQSTDVCGNTEYINIRVKRCKQADCIYKGSCEIDWDDMEQRLFLVKNLGWACVDIYDEQECEKCSAKPNCRYYQDL